MATALDTSAKPKRTPKARKAEAFIHDAFAIRTVDPNDRAYNDFQWPARIGALVECPDWNNRPACGRGFHALLDAIAPELTPREIAAWASVCMTIWAGTFALIWMLP